jgi:TetR/AcrR family transcriptional repressor of mexJK operon
MVASSGVAKRMIGALAHSTGTDLRGKSDKKIVMTADGRMQHLLKAAKTTFAQKGFAATTMDDVAGAAGMSKKTLYKLFASKSDLFRAMLLRSLPQVRFADMKAEGSAIDQLRLSLKRIADIALAPEEIALHRLIVGERLLSPDFAGIFSEVIFDMGVKGVVDALKQVELKPELGDLPLKQVAEILLGIAFGNDHFRLMADSAYRLNRRLLNKRVDIGISIVCATTA